MNITAKPEPIVNCTDRSKFTSTPVAFRASKWHSWRSYEPGNPRYKQDINRHFYGTERIDGVEVLCIVTVEPLGTLVETHCCECGAYVSGYVRKRVAEISWETLRVKCDGCAARGTSPDLPQDGARQYTPEYQAAQRQAKGAR